jgi:hypothetical protein
MAPTVNGEPLRFPRRVPDQYKLDSINDEDQDPDQDRHGSVGGYAKGNTRNDRYDMQRLGKHQELMRNFRPLSALSFTMLLQATWEFMLM